SFNRVGISYIFCNIHPRMSAIVVTLATPYFAISDEEGAVTIGNVPEGRYRLKIWHERTSDEELAAQSRAVRVAAGAAGGYDLGLIRLNEAGYMLQPHKNKHGGQYDNEHSKPSYKRQRGVSSRSPLQAARPVVSGLSATLNCDPAHRVLGHQ